jgi:hypothetical protein
VKTGFYSIWLEGERLLSRFAAAQWDKDQWRPFMEPLWFTKSIPMYCLHDRRAQHILPQVLSMHPSKESLGHK